CGRKPEAWQRRRTCAERVVRESEIRAIEDVEAFGDCFQLDALSQTKLTAQPQIKRSVVVAASSVSSHTCGAVVVVRIKVAVATRHDVEGQTRSISVNVAQLETFNCAMKEGSRVSVRSLQRAADGQAMTLVVVR